MNKGMNVAALSGFVEIFAKSRNVSISKRRTYFLMRDSSHKIFNEIETDS